MNNIININVNNGIIKVGKFGDGPNIIFMIPGLSIAKVLNSLNAVEKMYSKYLNDFTFYLFEQKEPINENYNIKDMAYDIVSASQKLNINKFNILGSSMGGMIGLEIAINFPSCVNKLIVSSTVPKLNNKSIEFFSSLLDFGYDKKIYELSKKLFNYVYSDEFYSEYEDAIDMLSKSYSVDLLDELLIKIKAIINHNVIDRLNLINCKTLIVCGKKDKIFDYNSIKELLNIKNSKIHVYENGSHALYDELVEYRDLVTDFIINK